jgi:hypothetical protein
MNRRKEDEKDANRNVALLFSAAYFTLSILMTITNKAVLSLYHFNFPFILLLWQVCGIDLSYLTSFLHSNLIFYRTMVFIEFFHILVGVAVCAMGTGLSAASLLVSHSILDSSQYALYAQRCNCSQ